ncbi:hypothetical protein EJB05_34365 [Eragrostis curvula]|uniref:Uncharacterized protein n=1 Tax=Eragrostis curvula TaxID=38414 RepID=A0A5J9U3T5_9POAL|nr:hypothetical protein EJB05_34365 [Eragrostis curvula]
MIFPPAFLDSSSWNDNQERRRRTEAARAIIIMSFLASRQSWGEPERERERFPMGRWAPRSRSPSAGGGSTTSSACTTANAPATHHLSGQAAAMLAAGGNLSMLPPLLRLADFDAMSLGSSFTTGMGKPPALDNYSIGGGGGMEQWSRVQQQMQQGFPFLHAMDHQGALPPSLAMVMPGAFQLGLDTTADGRGGGTGGEDSSGDQLNGMPTKREAAAAGYPPRGMYAADHHHHHLTAAGYTTSYSNATVIERTKA